VAEDPRDAGSHYVAARAEGRGMAAASCGSRVNLGPSVFGNVPTIRAFLALVMLPFGSNKLALISGNQTIASALEIRI